MKRRWRRVLAVVLLIAAVPVAYRVLAVYKFRPGHCSARPHVEVSPTYPQRLVVMTYNIEGHAELVRDRHIDEIAQTITRHRPDIVAINEAHRGTWQARFRDQVGRLQARTGMHAAFGPSFSLAGGEFGNAILTRGTIVSTHLYPLPGTGEPRSLLEAVIRINGGTVAFFATHLAAWGTFSSGARTAQLQCILDHVAASEHPPIVAGDLNAAPDADEVRAFLARSELFEVLGTPQPTHRVREVQLDHIVIGGGWQVVSARVLDDGPSDHRPVIAELERK
ncbi:MAG: endonuclease/exonuclease/phosphatase family protein [Thermoanaerobaculia bacterium]